MTDALTNEELQTLYSGAFREYFEKDWAVEWRENYVRDVERVRAADEKTWLSPDFQKFLWDQNSVANIGLGKTVTIASAYEDHLLAKRLFEIRNLVRPDSIVERGKLLGDAYDEIMTLVRPKHSERRPKARIVRLLALLFPFDMSCLMDQWRLRDIQRLTGSPRVPGNFVAQHPALRQRIRDAVGKAADIAAEVDQAVFCWFLWDTKFKTQVEGAVVIESDSNGANDLPPLHLLPANAQRRGLTSVKNNVNLLVSIVREAEQGISRSDLISAILSEASQLNSSAAAVIISQACGGLGLLQVKDNTYTPTVLGMELLTADDAAAVLRGPLIGRVFGMGHLLRILLLNKDGLTHTDAATRLQALVPTWTTTQPGSHIISWARRAGMVATVTSSGATKLVLTEEGEEYARALPEDFEKRWVIYAEPEAEGDAEPLDHAAIISKPPEIEPYDVTSIIADGCFLESADLESAISLLKRKKNLILQGPPGTGKTWLAKRLGFALVGEKDTSRQAAVQFQPSMSYEDFVRGYRPNGNGGLSLVNGIFLDAIDAANADPARPYVLVIEEINRGNPAQIFGELLTLLEADKRHEPEALRLAYPLFIDERIFVPENLHVIGTMNLADRSLAVLDLALRRRFAFLTLSPNLGKAWREWCKNAGAPESILSLIQDRITDLNEKITVDTRLGPQFSIGHSFVTPPTELHSEPEARWIEWFHDVVDSEIEPLLREYFYENPNTAADYSKSLRLP